MNPVISDFNLPEYLKSSVSLLENEAVFLIREAALTQERLGLIFNGGRDSLVMAHLIAKAFPKQEKKVTLVYLDTGYHFFEAEEKLKEIGEKYSLPILKVKLAKQTGQIDYASNDQACLKVQRELLDLTIREAGFDGIYTAARREDKHPQLISVEEDFKNHKIWDPLPERWQPYQSRSLHDGHHRMYPIANWSEAEILAYMESQKITLPPIYFAHERIVVARGDRLYDLESGANRLYRGEVPREILVRAVAVGDPRSTDFVPSQATTIKGLIRELTSRWGERHLADETQQPRFQIRFS